MSKGKEPLIIYPLALLAAGGAVFLIDIPLYVIFQVNLVIALIADVVIAWIIYWRLTR